MAIKVKISDSVSTTSSEIAASSTAVKTAYDKATTALNTATNNAKSVGDLWIGCDSNSVPANVQLYAGQLLNRSSYSVHSAMVLGGKRTVVTETEWQAYVTANGFCPYYSSGDGSTTYRMPLVKNVHPQFVAALADAGQYKEAGLPNITGTLGISNGSATPTGAFAKTTTEDWNLAGGGNNVTVKGSFDASRSNAIYGNSDTVQPPSLTFLIGEYVVGTVATIGEADAESLLASITTLESGVGALQNNVGRASAYITETWRSGTEWYRKWSDGWIEQGGEVAKTGANSTHIITFHVPFASTNYMFVKTSITEDTSSWGGSYLNAGFNLTKVTIQIRTAAAQTGPARWTACGY